MFLFVYVECDWSNSDDDLRFMHVLKQHILRTEQNELVLMACNHRLLPINRVPVVVDVCSIDRQLYESVLARPPQHSLESARGATPPV